MKITRRSTGGIIGLLTVFLATSLWADGVLRSQRWDDPQRYLRHISTEVRTDIVGQVATTATTQRFVNASDSSLTAKYAFPLPANASSAGLAWWIQGHRQEASIVPGEQDTTLVPEPGFPDDWELRTYLGDNPFFFPIKDIPPRDTVQVELTYIELLPYNFGFVDYVYPADSRSFGTTLAQFYIELTLHSQRRITSLSSPTHPESEIGFDDHVGTVSYWAANATMEDVQVQYSVSQEELGLFLLTYKPAEAEEGFFIMILEPDPQTSQEEIIDKVFTFIIDKSGSMSGVKIAQAKEAARYCVEHLNPDDHFNVIQYDNQIVPFRDGPVDATRDNVREALSWIDAIQSRGSTNINEALLWGLNQEMGAITSNSFIFLTDGQPTAGVTDADQILQNVREANTVDKDVRIFVFGIGSNVNQRLLTALADQNKGFAEYIVENEAVGDKISDFYRRIRNPLLTDLSIDYGSVQTAEAFPRHIPDIYVGQQLLLIGRYSGGGRTTVTLNGDSFGQTVSYPYEAEFAPQTDENAFIPRIWAKSKIDYLEDWIILHGENQEVIGEIIRLSQQYGIQSAYTHFGEVEGPPEEGEPTDVGFTAVELRTFEATPMVDGLRLQWDIAGDFASLGLNIWRSKGIDDPFEKLNDRPIRTDHFVDRTAVPGMFYAYKLEAIEAEGAIPLGVLTVDLSGVAPARVSLSQNIPNPFNPTTTIAYSLPQPGDVHLAVYDLLGQQIRVLVDGDVEPGAWMVRWDGKDEVGRDVSSGVYFYRLTVDGGRWTKTRKMVLIR